MIHSAIYRGTIRHRRVAERNYEFCHPLTMVYLDLDELPDVAGGRLVKPAPGVVRFRRRDYLGDPAVCLKTAVHRLVEAQMGPIPEGPVRVLTQVAMFGRCFNQVSFYYCFAPEGDEPYALVAEVTNTPMGERHAYVLPWRPEGRGWAKGSFEKALRVSPFLSMDQQYRWWAGNPGPTLGVHLECIQDGKRVLDATLRMQSRPLDRSSLAQMVARYPLASNRTLLLIYAHAVALRIKGVQIKPYSGGNHP